MKIKLDENLPLALSAVLVSSGQDVHTVADEKLVGHPDQEVWKAAQTESRLLITQDLDFSDLRRFIPGTHYGILLVRLRSPSRANLTARIGELFKSENVSDWSGCFVVATERKIRVIRREK